MREGKYAAPMRGTGYFNRGLTGSAGLAAHLEKARGPFTSRDGEGRETVDIHAPGYREAMNAAGDAYRPENKEPSAGGLWEMPWREREAYVADVQGAQCYTEEDFNELADRAEQFGPESLNSSQAAVVGKGQEQFRSGIGFMGATGQMKDSPREAYMDELHDTGRYVTLKAPDGSMSQLLMEMAPRMDVHRFLDLDAPEGQAQILELKEGDYQVAYEHDDCPAVRDGLAAARNYMDEHGHIFTAKCGDVQKSELQETASKVSKLDEMRRMNAETDARANEADGPDRESGIV